MVPIMIVISIDITMFITTEGSDTLILLSSISFVYVGSFAQMCACVRLAS